MPDTPKAPVKATRRTASKTPAGEAVKGKMIEVNADHYHHVLRQSLRLHALERASVDNWEGYAEAFDTAYDDACIENLPAEFLD